MNFTRIEIFDFGKVFASNVSVENSGSVKINKRQLNFTKTVGLSCFATAGLYVLPMIIAFYETSKDKVPNITFVIVIVITILNSFSKTIIVGYRSHDIRDAVIDIMPGVFRKFGIRKMQTMNVVKFKAGHATTATVQTAVKTVKCGC
ncbi:unnamed protein product [Brugia pahangi]|uniref:Col_cuticle_N domain-containing protein n=1 Tax=Brugia pahangi TaxID=6280 RepID=A0A0N4T5Z4_BRUPA|nr:unnamed protein product [Brugia pahangi]